MKITSIDAIAAAPEATVHPMFSFPPWNYIFVKVETDDGLTGWGDATCGSNAVVTMVKEFGDLLIGADPFAIEQNWQTIHHRPFGELGAALGALVERAVRHVGGIEAVVVPKLRQVLRPDARRREALHDELDVLHAPREEGLLVRRMRVVD